jgi:hypothetical protein
MITNCCDVSASLMISTISQYIGILNHNIAKIEYIYTYTIICQLWSSQESSGKMLV